MYSVWLGIGVTCLSQLLGLFGVIHYYTAAWISLGGVSISFGFALWEWLTTQGVQKYKKRWYSFSLGIALLLFGGICLMFIPLAINLNSKHGVLLPGNDPSPKNPCGTIPAGALALFYGSSASYSTSFPYTVLEVKGKPKIHLTKNADGGIAITMDVFDKEEDIIAEIKNNEFTVNPQKTFDIKSDTSHLAVTLVRRKQEVFSITYLNSNAIKIRVVLHYPGTENPVIITDDVVFLGKAQINENCIHNNGGVGIRLGDFSLR